MAGFPDVLDRLPLVCGKNQLDIVPLLAKPLDDESITAVLGRGLVVTVPAKYRLFVEVQVDVFALAHRADQDGLVGLFCANAGPFEMIQPYLIPDVFHVVLLVICNRIY
jgi:hypothetical protein